MEFAGDEEDVFGEPVDGVIAIRRPIAFAMPAQVEAKGVVTIRPEYFSASLPGVARLTAAMGEHNRAAMFGTEGVRHDLDVIADSE